MVWALISERELLHYQRVGLLVDVESPMLKVQIDAQLSRA